MRLHTMTALSTALLLLVVAASAAPWFDIFGGVRPRSGGRYRPPARQARENGYKEICRTINPDNYAFPNQQPFPSAPLCPWK